jgi:hypothetical protein
MVSLEFLVPDARELQIVGDILRLTREDATFGRIMSRMSYKAFPKLSVVTSIL